MTGTGSSALRRALFPLSTCALIVGLVVSGCTEPTAPPESLKDTKVSRREKARATDSMKDSDRRQDRKRAGQKRTGSGAGGAASASRVVVLSIDGLASYALTESTMPYLTRLMKRGAGTLNARTPEQTVTLPSHTSMITGRGVYGAPGHGVNWNVDLAGRTLAPGIESIFSWLDVHDIDTALYAGKSKFSLWPRTWPSGVDEYQLVPQLSRLTTRVVADVRAAAHPFVFTHFADADTAGHAHGWGSAEYQVALDRVDNQLARIHRALRGTESWLIVTADHGGVEGTRSHGESMHPMNYTIPFLVVGPGIDPVDLYDLNPQLVDPGSTRGVVATTISNGAAANLASELLGLGPVPDSTYNAGQELEVRVASSPDAKG